MYVCMVLYLIGNEGYVSNADLHRLYDRLVYSLWLSCNVLLLVDIDTSQTVITDMIK